MLNESDDTIHFNGTDQKFKSNIALASEKALVRERPSLAYRERHKT